MLRNMQWHDQRPLLRDIRVPVLVIKRKDDVSTAGAMAHELAALIPNARLLVLDGADHIPTTPEQEEELTRPMLEFLAESQDEANDSEPPGRGLQTIMFTDLESSTTLTQKVDNEAAQDVLNGHNNAVRKSLEVHGGREVKHTGDGIMAAFPSAVRAVEAALQIQRDLAGG